MPTWKQVSTNNTHRPEDPPFSRDTWNPGEGHFVRKGVVGDSVSYFDDQEREDWDEWAADNLARLGIKEERVLKMFSEKIHNL